MCVRAVFYVVSIGVFWSEVILWLEYVDILFGSFLHFCGYFFMSLTFFDILSSHISLNVMCMFISWQMDLGLIP